MRNGRIIRRTFATISWQPGGSCLQHSPGNTQTPLADGPGFRTPQKPPADEWRSSCGQGIVGRCERFAAGTIVTTSTVAYSFPVNRQSLPFASSTRSIHSENIGSVTQSGSRVSSDTRSAACAFQAISIVPFSTSVSGECYDERDRSVSCSGGIFYHQQR